MESEYFNSEIKKINEEELMAALKIVNDKNREIRKSFEEGMAEVLNGGTHSLIEYLRREVMKGGYTEFRLVVRDNGTAYIHAMGRDSKTLDFTI